MRTLRMVYGIPEGQLLTAGSHRETRTGEMVHVIKNGVLVGIIDGVWTYEFGRSFCAEHFKLDDIESGYVGEDGVLRKC